MELNGTQVLLELTHHGAYLTLLVEIEGSMRMHKLTRCHGPTDGGVAGFDKIAEKVKGSKTANLAGRLARPFWQSLGIDRAFG